MKGIVKAKVLLLFSMSFLVQGCDGDLKKEYVSQVEELGYTPLYPPRENFGPNLIFQLLPEGKRARISPVCTKFVETDSIGKSAAALPKLARIEGQKVGIAVDLMKGLVANIEGAKANLGANRVSAISLILNDGLIQELSQDSRFGKDGKKLPIVPSCAARLAEIKKEHKKLDGVLYFVQATLTASKSSLKVEFDKSLGASASIDVRNLLQIKPEISTTDKGNGTIEFNEPLTIGYTAIALVDFIPSNELGPETGTVYSRDVQKSELQLLESAE